jgi:hypothetical protein
MAEKYLKVSDFVAYILDNRDLFIAEKLTNLKSQDDEFGVFGDYFHNFMINIQDSIDFELTMQIIVKAEIESVILD